MAGQEAAPILQGLSLDLVWQPREDALEAKDDHVAGRKRLISVPEAAMSSDGLPCRNTEHQLWLEPR